MKIVLLACISCLMFSCTQAAGSCDAGVRPGRNNLYEVDEACFRQCYATCDYRRSHVLDWGGNCQNDCEENCNRCNKYVWDRLDHDPRCPPPKCLLKNEAWKACLEDPKVPRGYLDRAIKILTNKGIYDKYLPLTKKHQIFLLSVQDPRFKRRWMPIFSTNKEP